MADKSSEKPAEKPTALERAVRAELSRILAEKGPLTPRRLKRLIDVARHGGALLTAVGKDRVAFHLEGDHPEDGFEEGQYPGPPIIQQAGSAETFGARFLREIVPAIQEYQQAMRRPTVEQLIRAIVDARTAGLADIEANLRAELANLLEPVTEEEAYAIEEARRESGPSLSSDEVRRELEVPPPEDAMPHDALGHSKEDAQ